MIFIKILFRNIKNNKVSFLTKIFGLAIGLTCFFLIFLFVQYEFSYDKNLANSEQIYRIVKQNNRVHLGSDIVNAVPGPLAPFIKENFPEILNTARVRKKERLVQYQNNAGIENRFLHVDPEFLNMFSIVFQKGNSKQALNTPNSIVITKSIAQKYFGDNNPLGENFTIDENSTFEITGVVEDAPANSHIQYDFLASINSELQNYYNWRSNNFKTYVQIDQRAGISDLDKRISLAINELRGKDKDLPYIIQPITDIHLKGTCNLELEKNGSIRQVHTFLTIGIFILLIACFNYINLTTAHAMDRMKELSIKKVIGAKKYHLFFQIIGESTFHILISTLLAIVMVGICLPYLNGFLDKEISFLFLLNFRVLSGLIISTILVCLLSGIIPAIIITKFEPLQIVKNSIHIPKNNVISLRNLFVVSQFIISILLIIGALSIHKQLKYMQNKDLGYETNNILTSYIMDFNCSEKYPILKAELLKNPNIYDVTVSSQLPNEVTSSSSATLEKKVNNETANYQVQVEPNFFNFYGLTLKQGEFFPELANLNSNFYILNEAAVKMWNSSDIIGKRFDLAGRYFDEGTILGIVDDIHFQSLHLNIAPLAISNMREQDCYLMARYLSIKISPQNLKQTIAEIENIFKQFSPNYPFNYSFFDNQIENAYANETNFQSLVKFFSILAIFIACLGLFGLAKYNLKKRIKEIGIRKINGAKVSEILTLLNKDFIKWVAIAFVVACPIAYYALNKWLENFAYKTTLGWWIFALAGVLALGIALLTVSWQSWRAATRNPVEALRYE